MTEYLPDTNVGNIEYISKQDVVDALAKTMPTPATPDGAGEFDHEIHIADEAFADAIRIIESIEPSDVVSVEALQAKISKLKYQMDCRTPNIDYYTGYMSALSTVEGILAGMDRKE